MRLTRLVEEASARLKDHKVSVIELRCHVCDRHGAYQRKLLAKAFGAGVSFSEIRRRMAMGWARLQAPEGDRCGAHFPCLRDE